MTIVKLIIVADDGKEHPYFELATLEEARAHEAENARADQ